MDAGLFLDTAACAERLVGSGPVGDRWDAASALQGYTVGGLAGHLSRAVLTVQRYLDDPVPVGRGDVTDAPGYLVRVLGAHDPVDSEFHQRVRQRGDEAAAGGPAAVTARLRAARRELAERLSAEDPDRPVAVLDDTLLPLAEYLDTRLVELVVHLDDLAVSTDRDGPDGVPDEAYERVAGVLVRVAARRAGPLVTLRSLSRRERHPGAVRAL